MKKPGYYSSGEFARMAGVTLRTIRYYDKRNILKPSLVSEAGARFYTEEDFARLQQILLLKYLGFSLDDIREMTIDDVDYHFLLNSLGIQLKLVKDRLEQIAAGGAGDSGYNGCNPDRADGGLEQYAEFDPPDWYGKESEKSVSGRIEYFGEN